MLLVQKNIGNIQGSGSHGATQNFAQWRQDRTWLTQVFINDQDKLLCQISLLPRVFQCQVLK